MGAVHEIEALILCLIAAVPVSAAAIIGALVDVQHSVDDLKATISPAKAASDSEGRHYG